MSEEQFRLKVAEDFIRGVKINPAESKAIILQKKVLNFISSKGPLSVGQSHLICQVNKLGQSVS